MEARKFVPYLKAIEALEAREQLALITSTMFPNLKKHDRKSLYSKITRRTKNVVEQVRELASWDSFKVIKRG